MNSRTIEIETAQRWSDGRFIEEADPGLFVEFDLPWIPYEGYMQAQLIVAIPEKLGLIRVSFLPGATEGKIHSHDYSDRIVVPRQGSAEFVCLRNETLGNKAIERFRVAPGHRIYIPRRGRHTFIALSGEDFVVDSVTSPVIVPFDDPRCITYLNDTGGEK